MESKLPIIAWADALDKSRRSICTSLFSSSISLFEDFSSDTVSSLFGLCSHKVDGVVRVWQCGQTASLPRMVGGAA